MINISKRKRIFMKKNCRILKVGVLLLILVLCLSCKIYDAKATEDQMCDIDLTDEEYEYILQQKEIRLAFLQTRPPLSFADQENNISGINVDIMRWVEEHTGLKFSYIVEPAGTNPVEFVEEGNADVAVGVLNYGDNAINPNIMMTDTFFSSDISLVAKKGTAIDINGSPKVLVSKGYRMAYQYLTDHFPNYDVDYANNVEESLKAVQRGEADLAFQNIYVLNEYLVRPSYKDLCLFKSSLTTENIACAVSARQDRILVDILNKAFSAMPDEYTRQLIVDYTITRTYYPTLSEYIENDPAFFILIVLIILAILVSIVLLLKLEYRKNMIQVMEKSAEAIEDEKEMYRIFAAGSKDILFYIDWTTKEFHWPDNWEERIGYAPPKLFEINSVMSFLRKSVDKRDTGTILEMIQKLQHGENHAEANIRLRFADGKCIWHNLQVKRMEKKGVPYRLLGRMTDVDNEIRQMQQLSDASMRDKLTGLYNKDAFYTLAGDAIMNSTEQGLILFFDLDNFKSVNDLLGHLAGDEILVNVSQCMKKVFRNEDIIARFGGDEFVIFARGINEQVAISKIELLQKEITRVKKECGAENTGLSVCIGVSMYPADSDNIVDLVQRADEAMYQIKQNGKNGYGFCAKNCNL